jgi:hypothetical protein
MGTVALAPPSSPTVNLEGGARWIISKREDLTWFIGSALPSYLALGLLAAGAPLVPLQLLWFFGLDGPHVLATVTRTYCDKEARGKLGWFLWMIVPLLLVGPAMAMAGYASLFFLVAVCWQHYHIVKQHFGFAMLYRAKNRERGRGDAQLDRWFLLASLIVPLSIFVMRTHPSWTTGPFFRYVPDPGQPAYIVLTGVWVGRQIFKYFTGEPMNWPKLALFAAVVPLQWLALLHASHYGPDGILRAGIVLGMFHGLQYHRLLWFHNRNRYSGPDAAQRYGLAARLATSVAIYLAVAIGLNFLLNFVPALIFPTQMMQAAIWGVAFMHYCLDARIWHVRGDKDLAAALRMV